MKTIEQLIKDLNTQGDIKAKAIIAKLAKQGEPALEALLSAAKDLKTPRIRKWSLRALGEFNDKRAKSTLLRAIKDPQMTVRLQALIGLRKLGEAKALIALLKDESAGIRTNALDAISALGDSKGGRYIKQLLQDPQWYVRQRAAHALGALKIKGAIPELNKLLKIETRKSVIEAAKRAITALQAKKK